MSCDHAQAVLAGEAPPSPAAELHLAGCTDCQRFEAELGAIDALSLSLPPLLPPAVLSDAVLGQVLAEMRPPRRLRPRPLLFGGAGTLAAAALLFAIWPKDPAPPVLVERGVGGQQVELSLKVAVRGPEGGIDRLSRDQRYQPGDTLYFRARLDREAWLGLVRVDERGPSLLFERRLPAGEADLSLGSGPLAWRIEPGEGPAVFLLIGGPFALTEAELSAALVGFVGRGEPPEADRLCSASRTLGVQCDSATVRMSP